MLSSYTVNIAYHANNPDVGMSLEKDAGRYKLFNSDVGLFITLAFKDKKYTYRELDEISDRLGKYIASQGIGSEDVVSILIPRCEYMAIAPMGVIKAGAAYQPLDPT